MRIRGIWLAAVLGGACGGDDDPGGGVGIDQFAGRLAETFCAHGCDQATMTCAADPPVVPRPFCDGRDQPG